MSLFEWSTPERLSADRILPVIPNEIYIYIFDHIAPPSGRLDAKEARIFADLSGVCRFFADFCLPRIFEYLVFSGSIFRDLPHNAFLNDTIYNQSREARLFSLINVRQPLALALAKRYD
ncbi:hypothetical protein JVU11DRAFT_7146 [Chiua virens]|nr:hypothetical protein JVU11DRAFT_7146 [Chiua virens]